MPYGIMCPVTSTISQTSVSAGVLLNGSSAPHMRGRNARSQKSVGSSISIW